MRRRTLNSPEDFPEEAAPGLRQLEKKVKQAYRAEKMACKDTFYRVPCALGGQDTPGRCKR